MPVEFQWKRGNSRPFRVINEHGLLTLVREVSSTKSDREEYASSIYICWFERFENRVTRYSVKDKPRKRWAVVQADSHVTLRDRSVVQQLSAHVSRQILLLRYESSWNRLYRAVNSEWNVATREWNCGREIRRNYSRVERDLEPGRGALPRPDFSHASEKWLRGNADRVYTSYTASKPISARAFSSCSPNCSFLSPLLSIPFSLSSFFFHPTLPFASFERLDNENRSRVSVLNECLREKWTRLRHVARIETPCRRSVVFLNLLKLFLQRGEEESKILLSAYFLHSPWKWWSSKWRKWKKEISNWRRNARKREK